MRRDGSVECWGLDDHGQATPPDGEFQSVGVGLNHTCGLRHDDYVECWGYDRQGTSRPPGMIFIATCRQERTRPPLFPQRCGVLSDGNVGFWYLNVTPLDQSRGAYTAPYPDSAFTLFFYYDRGATCGMIGENREVIQCWGWGDAGKGTKEVATPYLGVFERFKVSSGENYVCGVRPDFVTVDCFSWGDLGGATPEAVPTPVARPPVGEFTSLSVGQTHSCALRKDGTVACWGGWGEGEGSFVIPPGGKFVSLSAGFHQTCGVKTDGFVKCWGHQSRGLEGRQLVDDSWAE